MMDIRKIRCTVPCKVENAESGCECAEARDEITRLREALAENELYVKTWSDDYDAMKVEVERLQAALRGVIRVADRDTAEFNDARAALGEKE